MYSQTFNPNGVLLLVPDSLMIVVLSIVMSSMNHSLFFCHNSFLFGKSPYVDVVKFSIKSKGVQSFCKRQNVFFTLKTLIYTVNFIHFTRLSFKRYFTTFVRGSKKSRYNSLSTRKDTGSFIVGSGSTGKTLYCKIFTDETSHRFRLPFQLYCGFLDHSLLLKQIRRGRRHPVFGG